MIWMWLLACGSVPLVEIETSEQEVLEHPSLIQAKVVHRIEIERECEGQRGIGSLKVLAPAGADVRAHESLAAAIALESTAIPFRDKRDWKKAYLCAFRSIDALGKGYFGPNVIDDSGQKLWAAEDMFEHGDTENAANLVLRILQSRIAGYYELHPNVSES